MKTIEPLFSPDVLAFLKAFAILVIAVSILSVVNYWCQDQIKRLWCQYLLKKRGQAR